MCHDPRVTLKVGIAGWIDKSLIDSALFYPMNAKSSEERLNFYGSQFSLVEVDSTYYGMPKKENSDLWVARTPAGFTFDVKSFSLFTNHPTKPMALPKDIRENVDVLARFGPAAVVRRRGPAACADQQ